MVLAVANFCKRVTMLCMALCAQQLHASEASYITLTCDGKVTSGTSLDPKGDPITKVGVVVNLTDHSVSFNGYVVPITKTDAAVILFEGRSQTPIMNTMLSTYLSGSIDRVTGARAATTLVGGNITTNGLYMNRAEALHFVGFAPRHSGQLARATPSD